MITVSDRLRAIIDSGTYVLHTNVSSWLDGVLLSDDVPVVGMSLEEDATMRVPERLVFTVPATADGVDWSPVYDDHPLAANGQRLRVQVGIGVEGSSVEWFQLGWLLLRDANANGDTVTVSAVGLLDLLREAELVSPYQPAGTLVDTLRGLVEPALTVLVDGALVDRSVPAGINYDEDRLDAVYQLGDAWPADLTVSADGHLTAAPITTPTAAVKSLTHGVNGTVIRVLGSSTREGAANAVVARGTATDGGQVMGVAYDLTAGPKRYGGPFNPLPVPFRFDSGLLTTVEQAQAAAEAILLRKQRETSMAFEIEMVPDPTLQLRDPLAITTDTYDDLLCTIEWQAKPLSASGGTQRLRVRAVIT